MAKYPANSKQAAARQQHLAEDAKTAASAASKQEKVKIKSKQSANKQTFLQKNAKIDRLPKNVRETIPITSVTNEGVIETSPGTFSRCYKLPAVNFSIANDEEQAGIFMHFMDVLNTFLDDMSFQFVMFNHAIDKRKLLESIRIAPVHDALNLYRQEYNQILLTNLQTCTNSVEQDIYLVCSMTDVVAERAIRSLIKFDKEISEKFRRLTLDPVKALTTEEYVVLLYKIYNQNSEYDLYAGEKNLDLKNLERRGLSFKDFIAPNAIQWRGSDFTLGDTWGCTLYMDKFPSVLSTDFLESLGGLQQNMLISLYYERLPKDEAAKLVRNKLSSIEAQIAKIESRNAQDGIYGLLPPELERSQKTTKELMEELETRNQNVFFITITVSVFAESYDRLKDNIRAVRALGARYQCDIKPLKFQQEFAFNTSLPLCRNDVFTRSVITTEAAGVFIPFSAKDIHDNPAIYYGTNQGSGNMILFDRTKGQNANGLIFGASGSGKSFAAKCEMVSVLLSSSNSQVFVIDPQGEYTPLVNGLNGQEIRLAPGNNVFINPLDLNLKEGEEEGQDPITMKTDYVITLIELMAGHPLMPGEKNVIDKCVKRIYRAYVDELGRTGQDCNPQKAPTLTDLYRQLSIYADSEHGEFMGDARCVMEYLFQYTVGSFDTFGHRTNVKTDTRFIVYNIKSLGSAMRTLGLYICLNDIWTRMIANSSNHRYTWFYIDEFHILLEDYGTTLFLKRIWKMARKWLGVPTGITQNTEDILRDDDTSAIFKNTNFMLILKEPFLDRQNLQINLNLSDSQLEYITESDRGCGLLYNGKAVVPFKYEFPRNTELYKLLTTSHDV